VPDQILERVGAAMAERDPQAESMHELDCPSCNHHWRAAFEIDAYLWREVEAEARRIFGQIDVLARTYGWSEAQILELSPARRRLYVEMIAS
jgi:hypothetical protein